MLDLQALLIFQTVAGCGSFSAASCRLNYAQSNISTKIQQLETDLNTTLFYRHNRGVTLTKQGELLLEYADRLLRLCREAESVLQDPDTCSGTFRIGALETISNVSLPGLLTRYHARCPEVQLSVVSGNSADLIEAVLNRSLDAAFISGICAHPELTALRYGEERLVLAAASALPDDTEPDLKTHPILVYTYGCYYRSLLEQYLLEQEILPRQTIEFSSTGALLSSLCAGLGISMLPDSLLSDLRSRGQIRTFSLPERYAQVSTWFIYRTDTYRNGAFRAFCDMMEPGSEII